MKVIKFGGTSVANAENIDKVVAIVQKAGVDEPCAVILSAMSGTTDTLIEAGLIAARGDNSFTAKISEISELHTRTVQRLFTGSAPGSINEFIIDTVKELESLCEGVSLLRELSPKRSIES